MHAINQTLHLTWLSLLTVIILCASITSQASIAEYQQTKIELKLVSATDTSTDDERIGGFEPYLNTKGMRIFLSANITELPFTLSHSDAYSSLILHGPPVTPQAI